MPTDEGSVGAEDFNEARSDLPHAVTHDSQSSLEGFDPRQSEGPVRVPPEGFSWWDEGSRFALTFDGYGRCKDVHAVAVAVRREFEEKGELSNDLEILRAALFWEQRFIRWNDQSDLLSDERYGGYLEELVGRIRYISSGWVAVLGPLL